MLTYSAGMFDPATRLAALQDAADFNGIEFEEGRLEALAEALDAMLPTPPDTTSEIVESISMYVANIAVTLLDMNGQIVTKSTTEVADAIAAPAAIAGGEAPTEAEHNALRATVADLVTKLNALLAVARDKGLVAEED